MSKVGDRIGAILGTTDDKVVRYLGVGTYQGEHIPPEDVGGFNMGFPNPKLVLDNGDVVWGCECWWGSESGIKSKLEQYRAAGYTITTVAIAEAREEAKSSAE
jgi:hypothetical protein